MGGDLLQSPSDLVSHQGCGSHTFSFFNKLLAQDSLSLHRGPFQVKELLLCGPLGDCDCL